MEPEEAAGTGPALREAAAGMAAALLGSAIGDPGIRNVAAAGSLPFFTWLANEIGDEWRALAGRRATATLIQACESSGGDFDAFAATVTATDDTRFLAGAALRAAADARYPWKVLALGRALAAGLIATDDAVIDEQALVIAAIADIEAPHLGVLDLMSNWKRPIPTLDLSPWALLQLSRRADDEPADAWTEPMLERYRPQAARLLAALLGPLERHGLIERRPNLVQALSQFGKAQASVARRGQLGAGGFVKPPSGLRINAPDVLTVTPLGEATIGYFVAAGAEFEQVIVEQES